MRDNLERVDTSLINVQYLATHSTQWLHDGTAFPVLTSRVSRILLKSILGYLEYPQQKREKEARYESLEGRWKPLL